MFGRNVAYFAIFLTVLVSLSAYIGTVDVRSHFLPLLKSPLSSPSPCSAASSPPLRVYMYDLPRRFNVGMLNRRLPDEVPVNYGDLPRWPPTSGLKKQHSVEYWMMSYLMFPGSKEEWRQAVRVMNPELADVFFLPFFSSLSFNTHGHNMTDPATEIDHQLQVDAVEFLRKSKYWRRSSGRDHVIPMHHPNAFRFLRQQVNASILVVADFGRYPKTMSTLRKDVVAPYVHVVDAYGDDDTLDPFENRTTLLFFKGRTVRKDEGIVRAKLASVNKLSFSSGGQFCCFQSIATGGLSSVIPADESIMRTSINRPPTPDVEEARDQEPTLEEIINFKLIESGEKERLKELLRERLAECGWKDEMKALCREFTRKKGRENVTVDDLVRVITPKGRASVPDSVKAELLQRIRTFLASTAL